MKLDLEYENLFIGYLIEIHKAGRFHLLENIVLKMPKEKRQALRSILAQIKQRLDDMESAH